jgi:hypothetical protein
MTPLFLFLYRNRYSKEKAERKSYTAYTAPSNNVIASGKATAGNTFYGISGKVFRHSGYPGRYSVYPNGLLKRDTPALCSPSNDDQKEESMAVKKRANGSMRNGPRSRTKEHYSLKN